MPKAIIPHPILNKNGKYPVPKIFFPFTYSALYHIGPITFVKARKEDLSPANSPCGTLDLAPSAYKAAVTPSVCTGPRKPIIVPKMRPLNESSDAAMGDSIDEKVAIAVKCLIPSFSTILLPTMFAKMFMMPIMAINDEKSFVFISHSVLRIIWKVSRIWEGRDWNIIKIANIRTSLECRVRILVQEDNGDCSSCFRSRVLLSFSGMTFDGKRVSRNPTETSRAVKIETIVDAK